MSFFRLAGRTVVVALVLLVGFPLFAQDQALLDRMDDLHEDGEHEQILSLAEDALNNASSGRARSELYWRMARATLNTGDDAEEAGATEAELLAIFERGEAFGRQAIEADQSNHLAYYWTSSNIGRWGQIRGVLNALFRAGEMRDLLVEAITREPNHADSYYVLGQLYAAVPGGIISFGNDEYAVSLSRRSLSLFEQDLATGDDDPGFHHHIKLAEHLIQRGWDVRRRQRFIPPMRQRFNAASTPLERGFFYEGTLNLRSEDDVAEARRLLNQAINGINNLPDIGDGDRRDLEEAQELLASIS